MGDDVPEELKEQQTPLAPPIVPSESIQSFNPQLRDYYPHTGQRVAGMYPFRPLYPHGYPLTQLPLQHPDAVQLSHNVHNRSFPPYLQPQIPPYYPIHHMWQNPHLPLQPGDMIRSQFNPVESMPLQDFPPIIHSMRSHSSPSACLPCFQAKTRCDFQRPCARCMKRSRPEECIDRELRKRKKPVSVACYRCIKAKSACDTRRPCSRCVKWGSVCEDRLSKPKIEDSPVNNSNDTYQGEKDSSFSFEFVLRRLCTEEIIAFLDSEKLHLLIALRLLMTGQTWDLIESDFVDFTTNLDLEEREFSDLRDHLKLSVCTIPEEVQLRCDIAEVQKLVNLCCVPAVAFWFASSTNDGHIQVHHIFNEKMSSMRCFSMVDSAFSLDLEKFEHQPDCIFPLLADLPAHQHKVIFQMLTSFLVHPLMFKDECLCFRVQLTPFEDQPIDYRIIPSVHEDHFLVLSFLADLPITRNW